MKQFIPLIALILTTSCTQSQTISEPIQAKTIETDSLTAVEKHYLSFNNLKGSSRSTGTVSDGKLENGYLLPFSGTNYHYFDTNSYLHNRCFMHLKVKETLLATYAQLETTAPKRLFGIMECSNEHGGKIAPHRTHQNGLSVDFMTPLLQQGIPYTELDFMGAAHYLMDFDDKGFYTEDSTVKIDFELMAFQLLSLIEQAKKNGLTIEKIIWKTELRDELFATESGKKLKATGVYVTTKLSPLINSLHDDHYHVDFKLH